MTTLRASVLGAAAGAVVTLSTLAFYIWIKDASPAESLGSPLKLGQAWFSREVVDGGPIIILLYLLMFLSFALSLILAFRRPGSAAAFAPSAFPTLFGATAMWVQFLGLSISAPSLNYEGSRGDWLPRIQRPFLVGIGLSAIGVTLYAATSVSRHRRLQDADGQL